MTTETETTTTCCDCGNAIIARPGLCASVHAGLRFDAGCDGDCVDETSIEGHGATPEAAIADYRERVEGQRGLVPCDACGRWFDHAEWRGSCCEDCCESRGPSRPAARTARLRVRACHVRGSGSAKSFRVEVYEPAPGRFPWRTVCGGFPTFEAAAEHARGMRV